MCPKFVHKPLSVRLEVPGVPLPVSDCALLLQQETMGALQKQEEDVIHHLRHLFQGRCRGIVGRSRYIV